MHTNSLHSGQLFSALAALERWLCTALDSNIDVASYLDRVLRTSRCVALVGVLLNVGKYRPDLFRGPLRPLLGSYDLSMWDDYRVREALPYHFDAAAWARQGEAVFQAARAWYSAPHRAVSLRDLAAKLALSHSDVAEFLARATQLWQPPTGEKAVLEFRILRAELHPQNYWPVHDDATGKVVELQCQYPDDLQDDIRQFQDAHAPALQALTLPTRCRKWLSSAADLTPEQASVLVAILDPGWLAPQPRLTPDDLHLARVAATSTLLALGGRWLETQTAFQERARKVLREVQERSAKHTNYCVIADEEREMKDWNSSRMP